MHKTSFSIIIPVYNTNKDFLASTLQSLNNINYDNYEILIIDDGSNKETKNILFSFKKENKYTKVYSLDNHGQTYSRKYGVSKAKNDYIFFLDSDDIIDKDALKKLNDIILSSKTDVIIFDLQRFNDNLNNLAYRMGGYFKEGKLDKTDVVRKLCQLKLNSICEKVAKRELLNANYDQVNTTIRNGEDLEQACELILKANSFYYTNETLYYYRINEISRDYYDSINIKDVNFAVSTYNNVFNDNKYRELKKDFKSANINAVIYTSFLICKKKKGLEKKQLLDTLNKQEIVTILRNIKDEVSIPQRIIFSLITRKHYILLSFAASAYKI